jgi:prepilin-type N-terminal cleavage/methylation domain-containing protein
MKKKGFTLVELLAIIVILGIIMSIATPIIIKIINDSKKETYKLSMSGYVRAVEEQIAVNKAKGKITKNGNYNIKNFEVGYSGRIADKGSFSINNELVISAQLCFDTYLVKYDGKEVTLTEKGCEKEATVNLVIGEKKYDNVIKDDIETEFNISDDISDMTNIVCNNGATISMNGNTLKLSDVYKDTNCTMSSSINTTFAKLDNTKNYILMLKDENVSETLIIKENKNVTFDLNGKNITASNFITFVNSGTLSILNSSLNDSYLYSDVQVVSTVKDSVSSLKNIKLVCKDTNNNSSICNNGKLKVENTYIEGPYGIGCNTEPGSEIDIRDSNIVATKHNGVQFNVTENITGGTISSTKISGNDTAIVFASAGVLNVESGIFTGATGNSIANYNSGTINIHQSNKSVYISSLAQDWKPAVLNNSSGKINIKGDKANNCTNDSKKTTSGVCIYAEGNKDYSTYLSNFGIQNASTGIINVYGASIYGGYQAINNHTAGIINIRNSDIISGRTAIANEDMDNPGTINICSSTVTAPLFDINNWGVGTINYSNLNKNLKVYNPNGGTINNNYTGSCME